MRYVLSFLAVLTVACGGGGGVSGPSPVEQPITLSWVSGETRQLVGNTAYQPPGGSVSFSAPGFLPRVTAYRGNPTMTLWPLTHGTDEAYFQRLIYAEYMPGNRLSRMTDQTVTVAVVPQDAKIRQAVDSALVALNALDGPTWSRIDAGATISVVIDPKDPIVSGAPQGVSYRDFQGNRITGGRVVFDSLESARNVSFLTHEFGHMLGLGHSPDRADVMSPGATGKTFSAKERLTVLMLYQRRPGTAFPDDDTGSQASGGRQTIPYPEGQ